MAAVIIPAIFAGLCTIYGGLSLLLYKTTKDMFDDQKQASPYFHGRMRQVLDELREFRGTIPPEQYQEVSRNIVQSFRQGFNREPIALPNPEVSPEMGAFYDRVYSYGSGLRQRIKRPESVSYLTGSILEGWTSDNFMKLNLNPIE